MFKAEEALKKVEAEWSVVEKEERAAWAIVLSFQKKWDIEHPDQKGGLWRDKRFLIAEKMALSWKVTRYAMEKKVRKANAFFELKQRQWQDFLVRDEKRIKHCFCGERDNSRMVMCDECFHWIHLSCANLTEEEAVALPEFACSACIVKEIKAGVEDLIRHEAGEIDSDGNEVSDKDE